jgi:hypothetical protein
MLKEIVAVKEPTFKYHVHKRLILNLILSQLNPVYKFTPYYLAPK